MRGWIIFGRLARAVALVLLVAFAVVALIPRHRAYEEYRGKRDRLRDENRRIAELTRDLEIRAERLASDPEFAKQVAREAGMVEAGEVVFKFTNAPPASGRGASEGVMP